MRLLSLFSRIFAVFNLLVATCGAVFADTWVTTESQDGGMPLVAGNRVADLVYASSDFKVVEIATHDLATDIERVTGKRPGVQTDLRGLAGPLVLIGTLGKNSAIDDLIARGKIDASELRGQWETFLIATVSSPFPGVERALVIVGSDRRGTAFGVYELSQAIGVSPWHWWADVVPHRKTELHVAAGTRKFGPPSVQYRGIFINDEDWGLQPWAAKTFSPEEGGIGPKVYRKVFELLLRLKANTLWPAMHKCTKPFNAFPENARLAGDYAIVMGSSHAEPMLRNNVGEWTAPAEKYNFIANREGVLGYWDERLAANGKFENIYTLGMRGIHDSNMIGPKTDPERVAALERIFADQRALIAKHVRADVEQVPQMFCAYKEVLDLYRKGLKVPDDVTIVWPDDNFGYVRNFASPEEQKRKGGFGVYYHISYLGRPLAYLWLGTTPPALIWEEMTKAYDHGARKLWIVNVGDIKPAEIGTEFFLQMAWDINRWRGENLPRFLETWATREFGATHAKAVSEVMTTYYQLNYQRKPEHLQWWLPKETPRPSPFTRGERDERLERFVEAKARVQELTRQLPAQAQDAFTELVGYPVLASAAANERYFRGEAGDSKGAALADAWLRSLTQHYNETVAGGKWRGFMRLEPADEDWKSMRIASWRMPEFAASVDLPEPPAVAIEAENFSCKAEAGDRSWQIVPGLGRTGSGAVTVMPFSAPAVPIEEARTKAPTLQYKLTLPAAGSYTVQLFLIPTHPLAGDALRCAVALDDGELRSVVLPFKDGSAEWSQGVLNNTRVVTMVLPDATAGAHTLQVYGLEAGVVLDKIILLKDASAPGYFGPKASDSRGK